MRFRSMKRPLMRVIERVCSGDLQKRMNVRALDIILFGKCKEAVWLRKVLPARWFPLLIQYEFRDIDVLLHFPPYR